MTNKMKAIVATGYGSPDVLQIQSVDKPEPQADELLVKVITSAATTADTMMRAGKPWITRLFLGLNKPKRGIPGTGFSGVVERVGEDVSHFQVGDRVVGETAFGFRANAEYLTISERGVVLPLPDTLQFTQAANFCDGHLTSYNFLKAVANVQPGQHVLINGASGSLGTSAVQLAKYLGATVTAVCSERNTGLVRSLGADHVIDYYKEDFTQGTDRYDYVYDTVGKSSFKKSKRVLKKNGVYLSPVMDFPLLIQVMLTSVFGKKKARFSATGTLGAPLLRDMLAEVLNIHTAGKLKTIIDRQFPLDKLAEAHAYIDAGHKTGNVVIYNA